MENIKINHSVFPLENDGKGVLVVLFYTGNGDPKVALDNAVRILCEGITYHQYIDAYLENPRTRVIITELNDMKQESANEVTHKLDNIENLWRG